METIEKNTTARKATLLYHNKYSRWRMWSYPDVAKLLNDVTGSSHNTPNVRKSLIPWEHSESLGNVFNFLFSSEKSLIIDILSS